MNLDMSKYVFYTHKNKVIAVSTYAGKKVKGIAKCNPEDDFSLEKGKLLAAARCNAKVAVKRMKRAENKYCDAVIKMTNAKQQFKKMSSYFTDASAQVFEANKLVDEILKTL